MRPVGFLIAVVGPLVFLALGVVGFTFDFAPTLYISNVDLTYSRSPVWLYESLFIGGVFVLFLLLVDSLGRLKQAVTASLNGGSEIDTEAPQAWVACPCMLIAILVAKMIVFSQYSPWLCLAIAACAVFLIVSLGDRRQHRRSLASQT